MEQPAWTLVLGSPYLEGLSAENWYRLRVPVEPFIRIANHIILIRSRDL